MLEAVNDLIANKKIPALEPVQMLAQLQYVFTPQNVSARTGIDEIAHHRDYHREFSLFLPGPLPLVHLIAKAPEVK